mgnify:CR=1 FL=1|tara:strand:+ start:383 stop:1009 length:627 start_codon:yes stop_codon:yes gene_type:complete
MSLPTKFAERTCDECGERLPLNKEFFEPSQKGEGMFVFVCNACKDRKQAREDMQKIEDDAMERLRKMAKTGGPKVPHTAEMVESLMGVFGGVQGFSALAMKQYLDAPAGGRIRQSVLEMVTRIATKNTEFGGSKKPVELMTEEELEHAIELRLQNAIAISGGQNGQVVEGTVGLPDRRTEDTASGTVESESRIAQAIQTNADAAELPQ